MDHILFSDIVHLFRDLSEMTDRSSPVAESNLWPVDGMSDDLQYAIEEELR